MRYVVTQSVVRVVGHIWMPWGITCAQQYTLSGYDLENVGEPTRENVDTWLSTHAGDFREILDFEASLEVDGETVDIPWAQEESELTYNDCMYGDAEYGDE